MHLINELSMITIPVPHFRPFNVITNEAVSFRVFREDDWFKAVPQISGNERKTTGIPAELVFVYLHRVVQAANHMEEDSLNVIKDIILELEDMDLLWVSWLSNKMTTACRGSICKAIFIT